MSSFFISYNITISWLCPQDDSRFIYLCFFAWQWKRSDFLDFFFMFLSVIRSVIRSGPIQFSPGFVDSGFRAQQRAKYSSLQLPTNCIAAIRSPILYQADLRITNHKFPPSLTPPSSKTWIEWPQEPMVFSVDRNRNFSKHIVSAPTLFKETSKLWAKAGFRVTMKDFKQKL